MCFETKKTLGYEVQYKAWNGEWLKSGKNPASPFITFGAAAQLALNATEDLVCGSKDYRVFDLVTGKQVGPVFPRVEA